ncbi:hypothetical protein J2Z66_003441 [Paenibacillus eucommiae]|uniref:Uncharacterized protein n=1 Tax=Paenibacillus eucommiae TaxID=1355755 RepID=A0ABS4IW80_9BACL|nr:hypothetical protein [Paenibacillus eucommiae]
MSVRHLTMFFIVKIRIPGQSVTLMMIFIVKRGRMVSQGGIVKVWMWGGLYAFNDEKHR